jgi:putative membrane-bound dehydrogenase-like protein
MRTTAAYGGLLVMVVLSVRLFTMPQDPQPAVGGPRLKVPEGFEVELVAGPPLVDRPIVADFDDEGRLYVADSSGSNDRVEKQLADRPHRIVRLADTNGDGRYDKSVVFADKMMLPEGTMWLDGSLYVAAPPSIWKLTDDDGDGVADRREEWFKGDTLTGCANDLHGPYLGPDGWIYWTKGAFAQQTYERGGKSRLVTRAAHIFRRRPGEADVDVVMTGGMDNPVDVAFTPDGERILTATFLEHPQAGKRDALVHAIYGGVYGKPHGVLDGHIRTGDLMPVMCQLGPAVPAGLTRYASNVFGRDYRDAFFAALFNLRRVSRYALEPNGATFTARETEFLVSDDRDFHPTDVIEDADGSLLVVDTGPWYKLCCPTSQLAKPDVLGAIYRVRRKGAAAPADPRGRQITWRTMTAAAMTKLLDDSRPFVQARALAEFSRLGEPAVPALGAVLRSRATPEARRNAVWALTRIPGARAREATRLALGDADNTVLRAAIHSAGAWRDRAAVPDLLAALKSRPAGVQRAAAEALGRIGDYQAVPALLDRARSPADRVLEHSLTYALIEIGHSGSIAAGISAGSASGRRVALIALDQIGGDQLKPDVVLPLLDSPDSVLKETAWWIVARHPEWGEGLAGVFQKRLAAVERGAADAADLRQQLTQFSGSPAIQRLLADTSAAETSPRGRLVALGAMNASASAGSSATRLKELPGVWAQALARTLTASNANDEVTRAALLAVRALPAAKNDTGALQAALAGIARDTTRAPEIRIEALGAAGGAATLDAGSFELLRSSVTSEGPARTAAAIVLEKARLDRTQLLALAPALEGAGPLELPRLLVAFDNSSDQDVGTAMLAALEQSKARSAIRPDMLRPRLARYPASVKTAGEALLSAVHVDAARQAQALDNLLRDFEGGDVARGQLVFNSGKAACLSCHAIGYIGGKIGPDLTKIGQVRSERDLLEAIIYPSASFARGYETVIVQTQSGQMLSGALRSEAPDEVVLSDVAGVETRVPRTSIKELQPGAVSLMPPGFGDLLTRQELADLVAFLRAAR